MKKQAGFFIFLILSLSFVLIIPLVLLRNDKKLTDIFTQDTITEINESEDMNLSIKGDFEIQIPLTANGHVTKVTIDSNTSKNSKIIRNDTTIKLNSETYASTFSKFGSQIKYADRLNMVNTTESDISKYKKVNELYQSITNSEVALLLGELDDVNLVSEDTNNRIYQTEITPEIITRSFSHSLNFISSQVAGGSVGVTNSSIKFEEGNVKLYFKKDTDKLEKVEIYIQDGKLSQGILSTDFSGFNLEISIDY